MAVTAPLLATAVFPDISGVPADATQNSFASASADPVALTNAVIAFFNSVASTQAIGNYLGISRSRVAAACTVNVYELDGFLHGEPHGTPILVTAFDLVAATVSSQLPDQLAGVLSYHGTLSALPEHGPLTTRPTSEESQDQGATSTYLAKTRPRASLRGRLYIGPLTQGAIASSGGPLPAFTGDLAFAAHRLMTTAGVAWSVRSRVYGTMSPVIGGWTDDDFGVQRRRRDKVVGKTVWA